MMIVTMIMMIVLMKMTVIIIIIITIQWPIAALWYQPNRTWTRVNRSGK